LLLNGPRSAAEAIADCGLAPRLLRVAAHAPVATVRSTAMRVAELSGAQPVAVDMDVTVLGVLHDFVDGPG